MSAAKPTTIISHWNHMIPGTSESSQNFYSAIERSIAEHNLEHTKCERVNLSEGGLLSSKREYLQLRRKEHVFHICAAPFGNGFFISWWLGEMQSGLFDSLVRIPFLGPVLGLFRNVAKPMTYYRVDTALMFQSVTHGAVLSALDDMTNAKGIRTLSESERKPIMRDFFAHLGA